LTTKHLRIDAEEDRAHSAAAIQTAEYIEELLKELENLASANRLHRLSALLGASGDEARKIALS